MYRVLLTPSSIDGRLACFHLLAPVSDAVVTNVGVQGSGSLLSVLWGEVELLDDKDVLCLIF